MVENNLHNVSDKHRGHSLYNGDVALRQLKGGLRGNKRIYFGYGDKAMMNVHYSLWCVMAVIVVFTGALNAGLINHAANSAKAEALIRVPIAYLSEIEVANEKH